MEYVAAAGAVASLLGGVKSLFGGSPDQPAPPTVTTPTVMPTPDDEASKAAKRRQLSGLAQRRGRQSTILSDSTQSSDLLGA
mgnify:CR=1 FL=1